MTKAKYTPTRVAARPYQVSAYSRWRFGRLSRVTPPLGSPPDGAGPASASITKGSTCGEASGEAFAKAETVMAPRSGQYQRLWSGSFRAANGPGKDG